MLFDSENNILPYGIGKCKRNPLLCFVTYTTKGVYVSWPNGILKKIQNYC